MAHTSEIVYDENVESPRTWDNLGHMVCFHRRYALGDATRKVADAIREYVPYVWFDGEEYSIDSILADAWLFRRWVNSSKDVAVVMPLWLYDHGGQDMKTETSPDRYWQHAGWDSGLVGYSFVLRQELRQEYGTKRVTAAVKEKAVKVLTGEVEEYAAYLRGEAYGYRILDNDGEEVDSCYGYIGYDVVCQAAADALKPYLEVA